MDSIYSYSTTDDNELLSLAARCFTFIALLPIGILLGIPFPTAVRELERYYPSFIAWGWGVNGVTSVLASVVAIIVAMNFGFTATILIAAVTYLLGTIAYWAYFRARCGLQ